MSRRKTRSSDRQTLCHVGSSHSGQDMARRAEKSLRSPQPVVRDPSPPAVDHWTVVVLLDSQNASLFKESQKNEVIVGASTAWGTEKGVPLA